MASRRRPKPGTPPDQAVLIHLPMAPDDFESEAERARVWELEDRLIEAVAGVGEFDGNVLDGGTCTLYLYGPDAERLFGAVAPVLRAAALGPAARIVIRSGPPGAPERIATL